MSGELIALLLVSVLLGMLVPWAGMRMIVPSLRSADKAHAVNFRGRRVFYGLGIVWLIWAGCAMVAGVVAPSFVSNPALPLLTLAGPLALVAFALGIVDDAYGSSAARGFKGHLKAMLKGRLTTGGMKLLGIGLASLVVALIIGPVAPWGGEDLSVPIRGIGLVLLAGASIALTSNLFNLLDLRPGRALKAYGLLIPFAAVSAIVGLGMAPDAEWAQSRPMFDVGIEALAMVVFLLGPLVSVWRYDLAEEGMLGDSGANPMGAVLGLLIASGLPLWGLVVWTMLVLGLNLASERVSFSAVIDGNTLLRRVDAWGRLPLDAPPPATPSGEARSVTEESLEIKSGN